MPRYSYRCDKCEKDFEVMLSIGEKPQHCGELTECAEKATVTKIYSVPKIFRPVTNDSAGDRVKRFIEDSRHELKEQQKEMLSQEYKVEPDE